MIHKLSYRKGELSLQEYEHEILKLLDKEFREWVCDSYTVGELFIVVKIHQTIKECFGSLFVESYLPFIIKNLDHPDRDNLLRNVPPEIYDNYKEQIDANL